MSRYELKFMFDIYFSKYYINSVCCDSKIFSINNNTRLAHMPLCEFQEDRKHSGYQFCSNSASSCGFTFCNIVKYVDLMSFKQFLL